MRKKVDFVFRYEHKVRELESIILLRIELERRGYSVAFESNYEYDSHHIYKPSVFIAPAVYTDDQLMEDWSNYGLLRKIANLQWEQLVGQRQEDDINGFHNIKGVGQRIVNFCWGENSRNRIVRGGVKPENAVVVGPINSDLLRGDFKKLLYTKEQLSNKYILDSTKKWILFISSFAYCDMEQSQIEIRKKALGEEDFFEFTNCSYKSRDVILDWFESVLIKSNNHIIIYRPHPDETNKCVRLKEMQARYSNFKVIGDEALKHWINASDKVYNWYSTGIVDTIILNKTYRMLRPFPIRESIDYKMMHSSCVITSKEEFDNDYGDESFMHIIPKNLFESYYSIPHHFVYTRICDILEKMLISNDYDVNYSVEEKWRLSFVYIRSRYVSPFFRFVLSKIPSRLLPSHISKWLLSYEEKKNVLKRGYSRNVADQDEIEIVYNRLKPIVYGNKI